MAQFEIARAQAVATVNAGRGAGAARGQIEAAAAAPGALAAVRAAKTTAGATAFADRWAKSFEVIPFRPRQAAGLLNIVAARLPTSANDLTHEITLMAMAPVSLQGWSVRWRDPVRGGVS